MATGRLVADLKVRLPMPDATVRQIVFADGGRAVVTATGGVAQAWSTTDGRLQANLARRGVPAGNFSQIARRWRVHSILI